MLPTRYNVHTPTHLINPHAMEELNHNNTTHIAILPSPGAGHLIPIVELVRRLLRLNPSFFFTFILIPNSADPITTVPSVLSDLPATAIDVITVPPPSFPPFSSIADEMFSRVLQTTKYSLPDLRLALTGLHSRRPITTLVVDMFSTEIIEVGSHLGIKSSLFYSSSAFSLYVFKHLDKVSETLPADRWNPDTPLGFPNFPTVRVKDLPEPLQDRNRVHHSNFIEHCKRFKLVDSIILNSYEVLEKDCIKSLRESGAGKPELYPVGPLVRMGSSTEPEDRPECLKWLDEQPPRSVIFVSFGSGGTLSTQQVTELAWGLELSQQRFVWVVRSPNDSVAFGTYLSLEQEKDPLGFLPEGFLERTKGRGLVVLSWAPQVEILNHNSTGGFMTHCGWNSVLESVVSGVGLVAWPLYAEQRMNAVELVEDIGVAVRAEGSGGSGVVGREEVERVVRKLMEDDEGREIQKKMGRLKDEGRKAVEEGGSSSGALSELAAKWMI